MDKKVERPLSVTILALIVLIISVSNLIRLIQTTRLWDFVSEVVYIHPLYLVISGLVWGFLGVTLVWGLWKAERWSVLLAKIGAIAYLIYLWIDRLLIRTYQAGKGNHVYALIISVIVLVWIFWMFSRPSVKDYFGVTNE